NIFEFYNYRNYLNKAGEYLKENLKISYRKISSEMGFSSPNYFQQIINEKRPLKLTNIPALAKLLELNAEEKKYFRLLVEYDQCEQRDERVKILQDLEYYRRSDKAIMLNEEFYDFFSLWYIPVVWELCVHPECENLEWIAKHVRPKINMKQVKKALEVLQTLNLVSATSNLKWQRKETSLTTDSSLDSRALHEYHRNVIHLAEDALDTMSTDKRLILSAMVGASSSHLKMINQKLEALWKEVVESVPLDEKVEQVFQCNIQFFPISQTLGVSNANTK
ncbi:TIGR02147 family protein, partial [bacterium]|nr:TIGR02147 family protein [bacterium]